MLQSDYSDAYIVVKRTITITVANNRDRRNRSLVLKKVLPFLAAFDYLLIFLIRKRFLLVHVSKNRLFRFSACKLYKA